MERTLKKGSSYLNPKTGAIHTIEIVNSHNIITLCGYTFDIYHAGTYVYHEDSPVNCEKCRHKLALAYKSDKRSAQPTTKRWLIGLAVRQKEENARLDTDFRLASSFCRYRHLGTTGRGKWWGCKKVETPSMRGCCIKQCPYFNIK